MGKAKSEGKTTPKVEKPAKPVKEKKQAEKPAKEVSAPVVKSLKHRKLSAARSKEMNAEIQERSKGLSNGVMRKRSAEKIRSEYLAKYGK